MSKIYEKKNEDFYITSLDVSKIYKKKHKEILKKIRTFISKIPQLDKDYYILDSYIDKKGEFRPMYKMNQKGFALLVSKFTGKEALSFTYTYINNYAEAMKSLSNLMMTISKQSNDLYENLKHNNGGIL